MRLIGLLAVVLLLGGCSVVVSETPWFSEADAAGAPALRPGVWSISSEPECRVKPKARLGHWPKCADVTIFRATDLLGLEGADKPEWKSSRYILAATTPRMLQITPPEDRSGGTDSENVYAYLSVAPTATDAAGRIVEFRMSLVFCDGRAHAPIRKVATEAAASDAAAAPEPGGPAKPDEAEDAATPAEPAQADPPNDIQPLPGILMRKGGGCVAESKEALLNAARLSQSDDVFSTARWVRDGER